MKLYLSPHFDDVALSCGGAIHRTTRTGASVTVLTVCAGSPQPDLPLSPIAAELHSLWGDPLDVIAARRAEDDAAMGILGVSHTLLGINDCIYRGEPERWRYPDGESINSGKLHPADAPLIEAIAAAAARFRPDVIHAPLAIGAHVDHELVHVAALHLLAEGWAVRFYEDFPYADPELFGVPGVREATRARLSALQLRPEVVPLSAADLDARIASISAYRSQLKMIFGSADAVRELVTAFACEVGGGTPAERVWVADGYHVDDASRA
jgi:LmbE family N-acetylglucosaminyl deacetylase